jgi:subtilisin family serine protease
VVSAGNEGGPVDAPANCAGVAGVGGLRQVGTKVGFSSLGPEIALSAPAGNCVNTAGGPCVFSIETTSNTGTTVPGASTYTDQTNFNVGTSFSAPIVSGIAGLMLAVNGNLRAEQLIARLQLGAGVPDRCRRADMPYTRRHRGRAVARVQLHDRCLRSGYGQCPGCRIAGAASDRSGRGATGSAGG